MKKLILILLLTTSCASVKYKKYHADAYDCCVIKQKEGFCKKTYAQLIGSNTYANIAIDHCCSSGICLVNRENK